METQYKTRDSHRTTRFAYKIYQFRKECYECWTLDNIQVHHKDHNPWNEDKLNLLPICKKCHISIYHAHHTQEAKDKITKNHAKHWLWKTMSDETKKKMSLSQSWIPKPKPEWFAPWKNRQQLLIDWLEVKEWIKQTWWTKDMFYYRVKKNG